MPWPLPVHCDWSTTPAKRWLCSARHDSGSQCYSVSPPELVGPLDRFFSKWKACAPGVPILIGLDFPIGLPRSYAQQAGISHFRNALLQFEPGFFLPACTPAEISLQRPFYPRKPGATNKQHLVAGLHLNATIDLLRYCERATFTRSAACELFWTLGAKQVGRAAISGWRDLLTPAIRVGDVRLWPFDGELSALLLNDNIVVAESYPAETYAHLGLARGFGKTSQAGRQSQASRILQWCSTNHTHLDPNLESEIGSGFGNAPQADDRFDSFIGVLGLIEVVQDPAAFGAPPEPAIRNIEGWILGMRDHPST